MDMARERWSKYKGAPAPLKKAPGEAASRALYSLYRRKPVARRKGFELDEETFLALTKKPCHYCGCQPSQSFRGKSAFNGAYTYNGVDRLDSSVGYKVGNVVACCKTCNIMKNVLGEIEFLAKVAAIARYRGL